MWSAHVRSVSVFSGFGVREEVRSPHLQDFWQDLINGEHFEQVKPLFNGLRDRGIRMQRHDVRAFHVDPLECPCCKSQMVPLYRVYKGIVFWDVAPKGARKIRQEAG